MLWGIGSECAVRMVSLEGTRDLVLYQFKDGREVELSVGMKTRVMPTGCISPGGGLVCWLATTESNEPQPSSLMVHDVRAGATSRVEVAWPEANHIDWQTCWWIDDETLAVRGQSPRRESGDANWLTSLHLLRVAYPSGSTRHAHFTEQFRDWVISPDARHAFVHGSQEDWNLRDAWYMEIASGRKTPLEDGPAPRWQQDGQVAWRVIYDNSSGEGGWLCRFQLDGLREERVLRIGPDERLVSVSPGGRFAIVRDAVLRLRTLRLIQLATGEEVRINDASIGAVMAVIVGDWMPGGTTGAPWMAEPFSIWSPDETRFVVPSFVWPLYPRAVKKERLFLYEVPPSWLK
jgi:hypothetical protein